MLSFGKRLRLARERAGLTQPQVMAQTGISVKSLSRYETGAASPDPDSITSLCKLYDVSADFIMGFSMVMGTCSNIRDSVQHDLDMHEKLDDLSDTSREKAKEYIEMLKCLDDVQAPPTTLDQPKRA